MESKVKVKILHDIESWGLEAAFQALLDEGVELKEVRYSLCCLHGVEEGERVGGSAKLESRPYHSILVLYEEKK